MITTPTPTTPTTNNNSDNNTSDDNDNNHTSTNAKNNYKHNNDNKAEVRLGDPLSSDLRLPRQRSGVVSLPPPLTTTNIRPGSWPYVSMKQRSL